MEDVVLALQQQVQELTGQLQTLQGQVGSANPQMVEVLEAIKKLADKKVEPKLFDVKGVGRPPSLAGEEREVTRKFPAWQRKVQNFVTGVFPQLRPTMEWAAE